ncbi:MAG: DUF1724 domain-containing protein [Methanobrevibacter sp.]|uniref:helix-turn-helix transcriptional regulator n=1 Tax=Methanobrevibacter sp. TaxID=66852 RepID=UPI0026DEB692|nr:transcriptional regulator FilR1 domain-containing protein [Methanobrevibacter sp.]MDO5848858.1 DUF1724 domain-containing protein [Methanobrevibacter sp.]
MNNRKENYKTLSKIQDELKFLTKSEIRLEILNCLNQAPYTVKEIVDITGMTYSSVSSNVNKLEKNNNIYKKDNKFQIDYLTKIYFENIVNFKRSLEIITNFEEFWNKHNINKIDYESVKNLTDLYNSELVESTSIDIYKTYNTIKTQMINSKRIEAVFPYLHPDYPKLIENELRNGARIDLIINDAIYKDLILTIEDDLRRESMKNGNLTVKSVKAPLNIYLTICDDEMSLGLFKNDDSFDQNRILISSNEKSVDWGHKLFDHIKNNI